ncbi:MAG: ATP-binding protein [Candidatus Altiarchaeota archaeon]|nr:ATP-binding protein [Candidatus Altiarchaeota archaeon]
MDDLVLNYVIGKLTETPKLVKDGIKREDKPLKHRTIYNRLQQHADNYLDGKDTENRLIMMPGLRGTGKTTLLLQLYDHLTKDKKIDPEKILYFTADEMKNYVGSTIFNAIDTYIQKIHRTSPVNLKEPLFIFVDEAHYDKEWSTAGKIFYDKTKKIFTVYTGSSALDLELNVDAARRITKIRIYPMNYTEHITLKYGIDLPKTTETIMELIHNPDEKTLKKASELKHEITIKTLKTGEDPQREWENYLCYGGLPYAIPLEEAAVHEKTFDMIERVIEKDLTTIQNFTTETRNTISLILTFLALQKPGGTSDAKLAARLKKSPTLIRNILDVLEKTHLIFSVKPYGSAGKIVRKPWKYYFLSPSINAAIRFKLGTYNLKNRDMIGLLAENLVASTLFRTKKAGISYDPEKEGVDFLIQKENQIIPVEVGSGDKNTKQIRKAIKRYKSPHGIIIYNTDQIKLEENILHMPIIFFSHA